MLQGGGAPHWMEIENVVRGPSLLGTGLVCPHRGLGKFWLDRFQSTADVLLALHSPLVFLRWGTEPAGPGEAPQIDRGNDYTARLLTYLMLLNCVLKVFYFKHVLVQLKKNLSRKVESEISLPCFFVLNRVSRIPGCLQVHSVG